MHESRLGVVMGWLSDEIFTYWERGSVKSVPFQAYHPHPLSTWSGQLPEFALEACAIAADSVEGVNSNRHTTADHVAADSMAWRCEGIASSHIEGIHTNLRDMSRTAAIPATEHDDPRERFSAHQVRAAVSQIEKFSEVWTEPSKITLRRLLSAHRTLMAQSRNSYVGGELRPEQAWLGGDTRTPEHARFIPPPEPDVRPLIEDWLEFCGTQASTASPADQIVMAAVGHAQFEAIHPFADGNGRTGRAALLASVGGLPVGLAISQRPDNYIQVLTDFCYLGAPDAAERAQAAGSVVAFIGDAVRIAANTRRRIGFAQADFAEAVRRTATRRRGRVLSRLIDLLPLYPAVTAAAAAHHLNEGRRQVLRAATQLADHGILTIERLPDGTHLFECPRVFEIAKRCPRSVSSDWDRLDRGLALSPPDSLHWLGPGHELPFDSTAILQVKLCAQTMPRANASCILPKGHGGSCRSHR